MTQDREAQRSLLDRRSLLAGASAAGLLALLPSCGGKKKPANSSPFASFASFRDFVRSSPDHLSARAAEVVASKDYTRAVRFVRDSIAVLPPRRSFDDPVSAMRWGPDATLRAGAGTQRERAELLAAMLTAMGASATVAYADRPASVDFTALYKTQPPAIALDFDKLDIDTTKARAAAAAVHDPDPSAIVAALLSQIPANAAVTTDPLNALQTPVPIVTYTVNGTTKYVFALGDIDEVTASPSGLGTAVGAPAYPHVTVRLMGLMGSLPGVPTPTGLVELVAATYTADQLAGARLLITTASADPAGTAGAPPDQVTIRAPLMRVHQPTPLVDTTDRALWSPRAVTAPAIASGTPITLSGGRYSAPTTPGGPAIGPYGPLSQLNGSDHSAAVSSVRSLQVAARGGAFPDVQVLVSALDQSGAPVFGLTQSDFAVTDESAAQTLTLLSNAEAPPLKVLLAYDCSGSVSWAQPADKSAFDDALAGALVSSAATTPYLLGVARLGSPPDSDYIAPDSTAIHSVIDACAGFSDIWTTLGSIAATDGVSVAIIVSDFQASDDPPTIPALQQRVAASGLTVGLIPLTATVDHGTVDTIVQLTGATIFDYTAATFQQQLSDFVSAATARNKVSPYRGTYRVPDDQQANQGTRNVDLTLTGNGSVSATARYAVPAAGSRGTMGFAGLYLEITAGTSTTTTRRLTGPTINRYGGPTTTPTADDVAATRALLDGMTTVAFEPGSPTRAASLDDFFTSVLSAEPLQAAVGHTCADALPIGGTIRPYSASLAGLLDTAQLPASDPRVAPEWLRVAVMTEMVNAQGFARRFDVVPEVNLSVAAADDPSASFAAVMRATALLSLRETSIGLSSAALALTNASLQYLAPSGNPSSLTGFTPDDLLAWGPVLDEYGDWHMLVPTDPSVGAMWIVDPRTGTTVAVYRDATGGGGHPCANAAVQAAIALLSTYCTYASVVCDQPGSGPYACLGALAGSIGAAVVALFAAALLDEIAFNDIIFIIFSLLATALAGEVGIAIQVVADGIAADGLNAC